MQGVPLWVGISPPWHAPIPFLWDFPPLLSLLSSVGPGSPLFPPCCAGSVRMKWCSQGITPCKGETSGSWGCLTPQASLHGLDGNASNQGHLGTIFSTIVPDLPCFSWGFLMPVISIRLNCSGQFQPTSLPSMLVNYVTSPVCSFLSLFHRRFQYGGSTVSSCGWIQTCAVP